MQGIFRAHVHPPLQDPLYCARTHTLPLYHTFKKSNNVPCPVSYPSTVYKLYPTTSPPPSPSLPSPPPCPRLRCPIHPHHVAKCRTAATTAIEHAAHHQHSASCPIARALATNAQARHVCPIPTTSHCRISIVPASVHPCPTIFHTTYPSQVSSPPHLPYHSTPPSS